MSQSPLKFTVTNKTGQDLYGEYPLEKTGILKTGYSCCTDQESCSYCNSSAPIFAARSALVQVVLNNFDKEGVFTLRTGSKNNSPIKASFLFKDLVNSPNAVVESDEI